MAEGKLPQEQIARDEKSRFIVTHTPHDQEAGTKAIDTLTFSISEPRIVSNYPKIDTDSLMVEAIKRQGFASPRKYYRCSRISTLIVIEE